MGSEEIIRDFYNRIIGYIETKPNGDKVVRSPYRQILGTYDKKQNLTKDQYFRIIGRGDLTSSLLYKPLR